MPTILLLKEISAFSPEQIEVAVGVAERTGFGLTLIVTTTSSPSQPLKVGLIV